MSDWRKAKVISNEQAAEDMRSIRLLPEEWLSHKAGQHYELRLVGTDLSRKYSVVSSPLQEEYLEFGVQLLPNGALSPKLWSLQPGEEIEIRGPWGESFVWEPAMPGPLVLIGAGSGITPLLSMHAAYRSAYSEGEVVFIMSAKNKERVMHYEALKDFLTVRYTTEEGRIDKAFLEKNIGKMAVAPGVLCYVCGPDSFIDSIVDYLLELGFPESGIRSERFI